MRIFFKKHFAVVWLVKYCIKVTGNGTSGSLTIILTTANKNHKLSSDQENLKYIHPWYVY